MVYNDEIDAKKATSLVRNYLIENYGALAEYTFRLLSVQKNTHDNVWIVKCQVLTNPSDKNPTEYNIKVNIQTGEFIDINSHPIQ